ncbi:MAG: response regulator [Fibrobacter sp.]|nr:response regulator [Fibrobacter sp.]
MKHILIVDDNKTNLTAAKTALGDTYKITAVTSGAQALKFLENNTCDLILLDINMPEMDGFEVMRKIKGKDVPPIIFLTADNDPETEKRCLEEGAMDFIAKPFVLNVMRSRISKTLELTALRKHLETELDERTKRIRHIRDMMMIGVATMVESRDNSTGDHIKRTSHVVKIFAKKLIENGYSKDFLDKVIRAAPMHDLGKIAVMDAILRKQDKFTEEEFRMMKKHSAEGARIVKRVLEGVEEESFVKVAENVAHYHHERWNGSGYPDGLVGENIPLESRIMALADVFDALVSERCYKQRYSYDRAFEIITEQIGSHFDPVLGKLFVECRSDLEDFYNSEKH